MNECDACAADPRGLCFKHKLQSVTFGIVPGGYRDTNSTSMYDRDALLDQIGDGHGNSMFGKERVMDLQSDARKKIDEVTNAEF